MPHLKAEAAEGCVNGRQVAGAEQPHMHQGRVEVVDLDPFGEKFLLQRGVALVAIKKIRAEAMEHLGEGEFYLRVGVINGGVYEAAKFAPLAEDVAAPKIAMDEGWVRGFWQKTVELNREGNQALMEALWQVPLFAGRCRHE